MSRMNGKKTHTHTYIVRQNIFFKRQEEKRRDDNVVHVHVGRKWQVMDRLLLQHRGMRTLFMYYMYEVLIGRKREVIDILLLLHVASR